MTDQDYFVRTSIKLENKERKKGRGVKVFFLGEGK